MKHLCYLLLALVAVMWRGEVVGDEKCGNNAPRYLSVDCAILAEHDTNTSCRKNITTDGRAAVDQCHGSRAVCKTYTGMGLNITCRVPGQDGNAVVSEDLEVHRDGRRLGNDTRSSFVTAEAEGQYECLWKANQSSFANRTVTVDGTYMCIFSHLCPVMGGGFCSDAVYILWENPTKWHCGTISIQLTDGVNRNCSKIDTTVHTLGSVTVRFNVLGARPISLSVDMVWVDHYPVTLNFSLSSHMALSDSISHVSTTPNTVYCMEDHSILWEFLT